MHRGSRIFATIMAHFRTIYSGATWYRAQLKLIFCAGFIREEWRFVHGFTTTERKSECISTARNYRLSMVLINYMERLFSWDFATSRIIIFMVRVFQSLCIVYVNILWKQHSRLANIAVFNATILGTSMSCINRIRPYDKFHTLLYPDELEYSKCIFYQKYQKSIFGTNSDILQVVWLYKHILVSLILIL